MRIAALLGLLVTPLVQAAGPAAKSPDLGPRAGFLAQFDADFGGDDLVTVYFEDDDSQDITAGQGVTFSAGGYFRPIEDSTFAIDASLGYKFATSQADNADITVTRTVMQLGASYRWPKGFYMGAGLVRHFSPQVDGDGFFDDVKFDDATGYNVEIGWRRISLHYTDISYSNEFLDYFDEDIDASHIGLRFTWRFGQPWSN
jgi:hypothetical protein